MGKYSISKQVDYQYSRAVEKVKGELQSEGFGVLTEIDVKATLKKKLNKDFRNYIILGACNPGFAYQALEQEEELGLLLPCNVIVYEDTRGKTVVAAVDPEEAMQIAENQGLAKVAAQVTEHLKKVVENL
ncbi:MAG: DUF302 domain-containing protein [Halanaerobium sp.]|nr:DUF302 domain-containing protein [Halanaerobium sp.]